MTKALTIAAIAICFVFSLLLLSFSDESLTITTYYPSPYGSYRQLTADQIAIGTGYRNPAYADGSLYVQGNVGIGTTNPQRRLDITSPGGGDVAGISIESFTASPNAGAIRFGDNTGWKLHFGRSRNSVGGPLNSRTAGVLMTIQDNGKVGIGTTGPQAQLDVAGQIKITGGVPGANKVLTSDANGLASWQSQSGFTPNPYTGTYSSEDTIVFPNGFILKKGYLGQSAGTDVTINFATPFPNACVGAYVTHHCGACSGGTATAAGIAGFTKNYIRIGKSASHAAYWFAIGY